MALWKLKFSNFSTTNKSFPVGHTLTSYNDFQFDHPIPQKMLSLISCRWSWKLIWKIYSNDVTASFDCNHCNHMRRAFLHEQNHAPCIWDFSLWYGTRIEPPQTTTGAKSIHFSSFDKIDISKNLPENSMANGTRKKSKGYAMSTVWVLRKSGLWKKHLKNTDIWDLKFWKLINWSWLRPTYNRLASNFW